MWHISCERSFKNLVVIPFEAILLEVIVVIEVREELKPLKLLSEYVFSAETIKLYFMYSAIVLGFRIEIILIRAYFVIII